MATQSRIGWRPYVTQVVNAVDADATAFIAAAGITNLTQAAAISTLVNDLKTYGLWTKMKALYPMVGGSAASHKFNLKDPRDLDAAYRLVFNGGWTHTSTGALPNGTTGYADTKLIPSVLSTNSQHLSYYSRTQIISSQIEIGANSSANNNFLGIYYSPTSGLRTSLASGTRTNIAIPSTNTQGFFMSNRPSSTYINIWKNNSKLTTDNITSTGNDNAVMYIGAVNGTTIQYSTKESAFASIGEGFTDTEATNFYTAVQAYQTTLGRQVNVPLVSDTDAQTFLNAANITSFQQASAVNKLVIDLKAAGVWTKMKAIYPFVGGSATSHKFNLKDPRDLDAAYRLVFNGGWTHTSTGALPNGSNGYANTKFIGSTSLTNNSTHFSKYNRIAESGSGMRAEGVYNFTSYPNQTLISTFYWASGGSVGSHIGDSNSSVTYTPTNGGTGFHLASRTSNVLLKVYRDNSVLGSYTTTNAVSTLPNLPLYIGARNDAGSAEFFNKYEAVFSSIGDGLTDAEASALYNSIQTYQTSLGRAVNTPVYNNNLVLNLDAGNANSYPGTGTTWFDLASGNNGTITNGPTYDTTNGGSLLFDGVNDFSGHPIINFGTSSVSWSFWIKPNRYVSTFEAFIGQGQYNVNGGGLLYGGLRNDTGTRRIQFSISSDPNAVNSKSIIIDNAYTTNTWMNLTITYNSSTRDLFMYINGVKQSVTTNVNGNFNNTSIQQSLTPTNTTGRMLSLCMYDESRTLASFNGNMATTQIYFRSLSDIEVLNYFNSTRGRFGL